MRTLVSNTIAFRFRLSAYYSFSFSENNKFQKNLVGLQKTLTISIIGRPSYLEKESSGFDIVLSSV